MLRRCSRPDRLPIHRNPTCPIRGDPTAHHERNFHATWMTLKPDHRQEQRSPPTHRCPRWTIPHCRWPNRQPRNPKNLKNPTRRQPGAPPANAPSNRRSQTHSGPTNLRNPKCRQMPQPAWPRRRRRCPVPRRERRHGPRSSMRQGSARRPPRSRSGAHAPGSMTSADDDHQRTSYRNHSSYRAQNSSRTPPVGKGISALVGPNYAYRDLRCLHFARHGFRAAPRCRLPMEDSSVVGPCWNCNSEHTQSAPRG